MVKVIVVDDEPVIRLGLQKVMPWTEMGCEFVAALNNGAEALESIAETQPDLVISDIRMPKMDGIELVRNLKELHRHIRVIMLTGHKEFDYAKKGIEYGVSDYILKPVNHGDLRAAILNAVSKIEAERERASEYEKIKRLLRSADTLFVDEQTLLSMHGLAKIDLDPGPLVAAIKNGAGVMLEMAALVENLWRCEDLTAARSTAMEMTLHAFRAYIEQYGKSAELDEDFRLLFERLLYAASASALYDLLMECGEWLEEYVAGKIVARTQFTVDSALKYLKENCERDIPLEEVAEHIYVSKWYFSKLFRKHVGVKYSDYLSALRIERAQKLMLENPALKTYEIAEQLGFGNVKYFSQLFKKITGMTPSEYRR